MPYADTPFSDAFCAPVLAECAAAIESRTSFNLVAVAGVGVTFFVKYMRRRVEADYIDINAYEMHEFSKQALYGALGSGLGIEDMPAGEAVLSRISEALRKRTEQSEVVVLLFHRFDRMKAVIDQGFYDNLRSLRDIDRTKIVMVFVTALPLPELAHEQAAAALGLVTNTVYFPGFRPQDMKEIMAATSSGVVSGRMLELAGGHHLLLQILMTCQSLDNPLSDPMVELLVKDIVAGLDSRRRRIVETVVRGGKSVPDDAFLLGTGFVTQSGGSWTLFSKVVKEYVARNAAGHLPVKERKLFDLLNAHAGSMVSKNDIFDYVWPEENGIASDWSLNALVYRLRRHPAFDSRRYEIESRKKEGYVLIDHLAD